MICTSRNRDTGQFERRHVCHSCSLLRIQGVVCHETGCPDAWQDATRECKWCGSDFNPTERGQRFCEDSCAESYHT